MASAPMVTTTKTDEGYRIDALPESFPRLSSVGATLAVKLTVPELCQLFAKFLDTPLTGPGVERILQVYLPATTFKHLKGKANTAGLQMSALSSRDPGRPTSSEQCSMCRKPWTAGQQIPCSPTMLGRQSLDTTNVVEVIGLSWFRSLSCPNPTWQLDNLEMVKHMKRPASSSAQKKIVKKPAQKQPSKGLAKKPSMSPVHKEEEKVDSPVHNVEEKKDSPAQDGRGGGGVGLFFFLVFFLKSQMTCTVPAMKPRIRHPVAGCAFGIF